MTVRITKRYYLWATVGLLIALFCWWKWLPDPLFDVPYATVVLDREDEIIGLRAADDGQLRFRETEGLPARYVTAALMYEDRFFMLHRGVNWWSLCRALVLNVRAGRVVAGGSTLSMQVVRMALGNPPRTIPEKIREIFLTLRLEQSYTKSQILNFYASHAPFGGNVVGLRAASLKYFHRSPEQLSWAEAALLAVLPNAPALIYPGKNDTLLKRKRDALLQRLHEAGMLSADDYRLAKEESLPGEMYNVPVRIPHLLNRACRERRGQVCRSFIDRHLQDRINRIVERHIAMLSYNYIYNAAVLVAHIPTGEVRAYVGNSASRPGSRGNEVDIIRSVRSSGSILKPALYALMQQEGFLLPATLVPDIPSRFGNYAPSNFNHDFRGAVPAGQALTQSLNIPFVRMLRDYTYARFYDDLKQLGITSLNRAPDHYGLSLILGGAETSLWDLCNMYGGMSAVLRHYGEEDGQYFPDEYRRLKIWDEKVAGKANEERKTTKGGELKAAAIWHTFKAMEQVERPEMESGWKNFVSSMNLYWKTGTSFGFRDAWAIGVNPEYVIGVWVGNADGEGRPGLVGVRAAAPVLFEVAALLPVTTSFYEPREEMEEVAVCRHSGYRASSLCDEVDTIRVCEAGTGTRECPFHKLVYLDASGKWRVNATCEPVYRMKTQSWFVLPPVQEWYYCKSHAAYRKLPPFRSGCRSDGEELMEMIYPQRGTRVFIPRDFGGKSQRVVFEAVHRTPGEKIYWHVDGDFLGVTQQIHQKELYVKEGRHRLTLVDGNGNMLQQTFRVVGKEASAAE